MGKIVLAVLLAILTRCFCWDNAPQIFPAVVHEVCPSAEERAAIGEQVTEQLLSLLNISSESQPPCACGGPGQWTRIAHLNMSDPIVNNAPQIGASSPHLYEDAPHVT